MSAIAHDDRHQHPFVHQAADFLTSLSEETAAWPSFRDGLHVQWVLDAVLVSAAATGAWTPVEADDRAPLPARFASASTAFGGDHAEVHGDLL